MEDLHGSPAGSLVKAMGVGLRAKGGTWYILTNKTKQQYPFPGLVK